MIISNSNSNSNSSNSNSSSSSGYQGDLEVVFLNKGLRPEYYFTKVLRERVKVLLNNVKEFCGIYRISHQEFSEEVDLELELNPVSFVVKYEGRYFTNIKFTNELRYVLCRLSQRGYKFTFFMYHKEDERYKEVLNSFVNVGVFSREEALMLSSRLAEVIHQNLNIYDRGKRIKIKIRLRSSSDCG